MRLFKWIIVHSKKGGFLSFLLINSPTKQINANVFFFGCEIFQKLALPFFFKKGLKKRLAQSIRDKETRDTTQHEYLCHVLIVLTFFFSYFFNTTLKKAALTFTRM